MAGTVLTGDGDTHTLLLLILLLLFMVLLLLFMVLLHLPLLARSTPFSIDFLQICSFPFSARIVLQLIELCELGGLCYTRQIS